MLSGLSLSSLHNAASKLNKLLFSNTTDENVFQSWLVNKLKIDLLVYKKSNPPSISDAFEKYYSLMTEALSNLDIRLIDSFDYAIKKVNEVNKSIKKDDQLIPEEKSFLLFTSSDLIVKLKEEKKLVATLKNRIKKPLKKIGKGLSTLAKGTLATAVYSLGNPLVSALFTGIVSGTNARQDRLITEKFKLLSANKKAEEIVKESKYRKLIGLSPDESLSIDDSNDGKIGGLSGAGFSRKELGDSIYDELLERQIKQSKFRMEGADKWKSGLENLKIFEQTGETVKPYTFQQKQNKADWSNLKIDNFTPKVNPLQQKRTFDLSGMKFAVGGFVSGKGTSKSDSIPAFLSNGEYVLNANAVENIGVDNLNKINKSNFKKFASGGLVVDNQQIDTNSQQENKKSLFNVVGNKIKDTSINIIKETFKPKDVPQTKDSLLSKMVDNESNNNLKSIIVLLTQSLNETKEIKKILFTDSNKQEPIDMSKNRLEFFSNIGKSITSGISSIFEVMGLTKVVSTINRLLAGAGGILRLLAGGLPALITEVVGFLVSAPVLGAIAAGITAFGVYNFLPDSWKDKIESVFGSASKWVKEKAANTWDNIKEFGEKLIPKKGDNPGAGSFQIPENFTSNTKILDTKKKEEFIKQMLPLATKISKELNVPVEAIIAQSAQETGWGQKILKTNEGESSQNLFNMKKDTSLEKYRKGLIDLNALEYDKNGNKIHEKSAFPIYESAEKSGMDYIEYIKRKYKTAPGSKTTEEYIQKLYQGNYATDPKYVASVTNISDQVSKIIKENNITLDNISEQENKLNKNTKTIISEESNIIPNNIQENNTDTKIKRVESKNDFYIKDAYNEASTTIGEQIGSSIYDQVNNKESLFNNIKDSYNKASSTIGEQIGSNIYDQFNKQPKQYKFIKDEQIDINPYLNDSEKQLLSSNNPQDFENKQKLSKIKTKKDLYNFRVSQFAKQNLPEGYEEISGRYGGKEYIKKSDKGLFGHIPSNKIFISKEDAWKDLETRDEQSFKNQLRSAGINRITDLEPFDINKKNKVLETKSDIQNSIERNNVSEDSKIIKKLVKFDKQEINLIPKIIENKTKDKEEKQNKPIIINNTPVNNLNSTPTIHSSSKESDAPLIVHDPNSAILNALSSLHQVNFI